MNELTQLENGIIGSQNALNELAAKQNARILLVSDSHGRREILEAIIRHSGKNCDALIFTGDGAGDFTDCLEKAHEDSNFMQAIPSIAVAVRGNNDASTYPSPVLGKISIPQSVLLSAAGYKIYAVHGHLQHVYYGTANMEAEAAALGADIAVFGHTHYPEEFYGKVYIANAGSCALPRRLSKPGFAIISLTAQEIQTVFYKMEIHSGVKFVPYIPEIMFQF